MCVCVGEPIGLNYIQDICGNCVCLERGAPSPLYILDTHRYMHINMRVCVCVCVCVWVGVVASAWQPVYIIYINIHTYIHT